MNSVKESVFLISLLSCKIYDEIRVNKNYIRDGVTHVLDGYVCTDISLILDD